MNSGHFKFFLHVVSPASRHQVRTFSSSYAPFFAVRQQTLSAISKCTLALACRETHEMHNMLRPTWSLLYPKGHGKLRHLLRSVLELAVTDGVWKIVVKHATKREPCSRCLTQLPQNSPSVLAKPSSSTLSLNFPWSSLCPAENEVLVCSDGHLWISRPSLIFLACSASFQAQILQLHSVLPGTMSHEGHQNNKSFRVNNRS